MRRMFIIYEVILSLVFTAALPVVLLLRLVRGKSTGSINQRFGFRLRRGEHDLWIHAVSVGEVAAARVIADRILLLRPATSILITTTTVTGQAMARQLFHDALVTWFPFDFSFSIRRFVNAYRPKVHVTIETEIWPNLIRFLSNRGIPIIIANARISDRSFPRYRLAKPLLRKLLRRYDRILAREQVDRDRFIAIGAEEGSVVVVGNVKFDYLPPDRPLEFLPQLERLARQRPVFVAGSTVPGEEALLLKILPELAARGIFTVIAPRKPDRFDEVAELLVRGGIRLARRSRIGEAESADVLLIDTIGELSRLYAHARVAFVGGSLVPAGGHNPVEPAAAGAPVAFGPHMSNFRDIAALLCAGDAGVTVETPDELRRFVIEMVTDEPAYQRRAGSARETVRVNRGAADRTARHVVEVLSR
jgi:3-deoxy-D-manno-octulosonic-acid transferase